MAIAYDFDGTLAPGNMQEHQFLPAVRTSKRAFWQKVAALANTPLENGLVAAVAYAIGLGDKQWLFNFITSALYVAFPVLWILVLSWAGYRLGNLAAVGQATSLGAEAAGAAGGRVTQGSVAPAVRKQA